MRRAISKPMSDDIKKGYKRWEKEKLSPTAARRPLRKESFKTTSEIELKTLYTPLDLGEGDYLHELGFPGEYPFARGIYPTMYRGRLWTMRQYAGYGSATETNARFRYLLSQGQTGLSVAFDLPTQMGYDSDHPRAEGEVGRVGVAVSTIDDMEELFADIDLSRVSTSMTINSTAPILLAMYVALARRRGINTKSLSGTVQNDILKEYFARGTYIFPPKPSMHLAIDLIGYTTDNLPRWHPISISGYHIREAGATAVQELAFTLADGIAYVQEATSGGLAVDDFAPRISFFFCAHNNLLEEVAKFRAARLLWARIMKERFGAKNPQSLQLRFHTQTAGCALTGQQPQNNVVRVAIQAMAAILGGTQSLHTNSRDEALSLPSEESVRIALRTQQIIAEESGLSEVVDPLGGSYCVEALTEDICRRVEEYLERIDDLGGAVLAVERGFFQQEIADSAYRYQKEVEAGVRVVVGVNEYQIEEEVPLKVLRVDEALEKERAERLSEFRRRRGSVERYLSALKERARDGGAMMDFLVEGVELGATVGEICSALGEVYGSYESSASI